MKAYPPSPVSPGPVRLLLDDQFVSDSWLLRRVVVQPRKHPGPLLQHRNNPPWGCISYVSVVHDPRDRLFKMWYDLNNREAGELRAKVPEDRLAEWVKNVPETHKSPAMAYAESEDGITWRKPPVGKGLFAGTNICFAGNVQVSSNHVFLEDDDPDPARRFKLWYYDAITIEDGGHCVAFSPDGINWKGYEKNPTIYGNSDANNTVVRDPIRGGYLLYMRHWDAAAGGWLPDPNRNFRRRIAVVPGKSVTEWGEPVNVFYPDELDENDFQGLSVFHHHGVFFGLLTNYSHNRQVVDCQLAFSRDGYRWDRLPTRPDFIPRGAEGDFDSKMIFPCYAPVSEGENLRFYYTGMPFYHDDEHTRLWEDCGVGLATAKWGRMIGRRANGELGILLTHPFVVDGDKLVIDVETAGHGEMVVEVAEPDPRVRGGRIPPGFARADCDVFRGDSNKHVVTWKGKHIGALKGKRVRLRIGLKMATIFSYAVV